MRRIEVQCGWCAKVHVVKTLAARLCCCSVRYGVRRLIVEIEEQDGGRCFEITTGTIVRVVTNDGGGRFRKLPEVGPEHTGGPRT